MHINVYGNTDAKYLMPRKFMVEEPEIKKKVSSSKKLIWKRTFKMIFENKNFISPL